MAVAANGTFTLSGASSTGSHFSLTSDNFGLALAQRFAGLTAYYAASATGTLTYPSNTNVMIVGSDAGTVAVDGPAASSALVVGDGTTLDYQGAGDTSISTGNGNDTIVGGVGSNDTIAAGTGNNLIDVSAASSAYVYSAGSDLVRTGAGIDTVFVDGGGTQTTINGSGGLVVENDASTGTAVNLSGGSVRFIADSGTATVSGGSDTLYGGSGAVLTLTSSSHNNILVANETKLIDGGSIVLDGSQATGGNQFWAGSGNATLIGGIGVDTLAAGTGHSTLTGGSGAANMFAFFTVQGGSGVEATITDFAAASGNSIALFDYGASGVATALASATQVGNDTQMTLSDGSEIVLSNFQKTDLTAADFTYTTPKPVG